MPSVFAAFLLRRTTATSFHRGCCSHRLKHLEKWNRRDRVLITTALGYCSGLCPPGLISDLPESGSCNFTCEKPHIEHKQCTCRCMETLNLSSNRMGDGKIAEDVGTSLAATTLHAPDSPEESPGAKTTSDQDESCHETVAPLDEKVEKSFSKSQTFPCSVGKDRLSSISVQEGPCSSTPGNSSYGRSLSVPSCGKLVSAMKGGRAQMGITSLKSEELCVKWAPEVRDPPTTSMSHTVRNHYQRPKAKKNSSKHKKKSPRGGGGSKSLGNYIPPLNLRLQVTGKGGLLLDGYNAKHSYAAAGGQQDKCRGNFLEGERLAAAKVQRPIAEAL